MIIYKYIVTNDPSNIDGGMEYERAQVAIEAARLRSACVVELSFAFEDSELVEDFREEEGED
jgi:hypothetical protein